MAITTTVPKAPNSQANAAPNSQAKTKSENDAPKLVTKAPNASKLPHAKKGEKTAETPQNKALKVSKNSKVVFKPKTPFSNRLVFLDEHGTPDAVTENHGVDRAAKPPR